MAEILDLHDNPLPGFGVEQTKLLSGDEIQNTESVLAEPEEYRAIRRWEPTSEVPLFLKDAD